MLTVTTAFGNTIPENGVPTEKEKLVMFDNNALLFSVADDSKNDFLAIASYNQSNEYFSLKTFRDVKYIQVLNSEGELEYQIPVKSNLLHISLENFQDGDYSVNIMFEGEEDYLSTDLTKK